MLYELILHKIKKIFVLIINLSFIFLFACNNNTTIETSKENVNQTPPPLIIIDSEKEEEKIREIERDMNRVVRGTNTINDQKLVSYPIDKVTHIFFHILVEEAERTYDNSTQQGRGYNSVMTSVSEFKEILNQMYEKGYMLISIHDMGEVIKDENGKEKFVRKKLMIPENKIPFVMSQDDVCYYEYMKDTGCATKLIIDELSGRIKNEYIDKEGNTKIGSYDLVPILDDFIDLHPDFSYNGAKAILALTGYNGIFGYRIDDTYDINSSEYNVKNNKEANKNIEEDKAYVKKLAKALYDDGYEFASHSWGHRRYNELSLEKLKIDNEKWEKNVGAYLPTKTDILIYPYGSDIGSTDLYTLANNKYAYLRSRGYIYYCHVDSSEYWVQVGNNSLRQGRRNIDGYRMWEAYSGGKNRVSDLFDVETVFDTKRPTPVPLE
ncbi:MAG: polysaccharide deacetylase family protein [Eubacteriales bacterium]|nr:polysaccharide deacetylase family protein [Eubacteriales bacterium]